MAQKRHTVDQIVAKLRKSDIELGKGKKGRIVEIVDWEKPTFKIYDSFDPTGKSGPAGAWTKTVLVLNDAAFFHGFWYATSYFTESYAGGSDFDENKFIRFKTLDDLVTGKWTDLSGLVPSGLTPYYLTFKGAVSTLRFSNMGHPRAEIPYFSSPQCKGK